MEKQSGDEKKQGLLYQNIWSWKFSLFGLVVIVLLLSLMIYRHIKLGVPFLPEKEKTEEVQRDTLG